MSPLEKKRIRVDWEELVDAFGDSSAEHRYYLDRETGAVHFFSSYLDNDDEEEDERAITSEERYVLIPHDRRLVPFNEVVEFVSSLTREPERRALESSLRSPEGYQRFQQTVEDHPSVAAAWRRFVQSRVESRIQDWLAEVAVEPID
jgi:hypothetical protein